MDRPTDRRRRELFDTLDRNRSGALDWDDFERVVEAVRDERGLSTTHPRVRALFAAMHDFWDELAARVDRDGDGNVTLDEWLSFHDGLALEVKELGRVPLWALGMLQAIHAVLDIDGDGHVTLDEYAQWLRAVGSTHDPAEAFRHIDTNGDGYLAFDEMEQLYAQWVCDESEAPGAFLFTGAAG